MGTLSNNNNISDSTVIHFYYFTIFLFSRYAANCRLRRHETKEKLQERVSWFNLKQVYFKAGLILSWFNFKVVLLKKYFVRVGFGFSFFFFGFFRF